MNNPTPSAIGLDPEWIPHAFEGVEQLSLVHVPRSARKELVFLTDGQFRGQFRKLSLPVESIAGEAEAAAEGPLNFIFHSSFCCSTLLAKALEVEGVAASLSEPNILVNLAERAIETGVASNRTRLELALHLLARPLASDESVIIKPSSFANLLIEPILAARPASRAVLLYSDVETFLISVVKRGLLGRINARKLFENAIRWTSLNFGFSPIETFEQTDLQIAALAWLMQIAHFQHVAKRLGPQRVVVLDAADLLARPLDELKGVQSFFELGLEDEQLSRIVNGPVFAKHSKFSNIDYDSQARERDRGALMEAHAEELGMVVQWLNAVAAHVAAPLTPAVAT